MSDERRHHLCSSLITHYSSLSSDADASVSDLLLHQGLPQSGGVQDRGALVGRRLGRAQDLRPVLRRLLACMVYEEPTKPSRLPLNDGGKPGAARNLPPGTWLPRPEAAAADGSG